MSIDWGGIIAGALGGAASQVQSLGQGYIEDERKTDVAKAMADIELNKQKAALDYQQQKQRDQATWEVTDPTFTAAQDARKKATGAIDNQLALDRDKGVRQNANDALTAYNNDPKAQAGEKAMARAKYIESSATLAQAALTRLQVQNQAMFAQAHQELQKARESGDEDKILRAQQKISDLAFSGKDTAKAYGAWQTAQTKITELETKLGDKMLDPAEAGRIKGELQGMRAMADQAAKELGIKTPEKQYETPTDATVKKMQANWGNPAAEAEFKSKFGPEALAKVPPPQGPQMQPPRIEIATSGAPAGDERAGAAADAARARLDAAQQAVQQYGLVKRQQDPAGFARAQAELQAARNAHAAAQAAWEKSVK